MITDASRVPLAKRALAGDGMRGALVAADGTIDWYCPGGFGADPACWRLLDPRGAAVRVGPVREGTGATRRLPPSTQSYVEGTNVVETVLEGAGGRKVSVTDALPWRGPGQQAGGRVLRLIRALAGPVEVEVEVIPGAFLHPVREIAASSEALVVDGFEVRGLAGARLDWNNSPIGRDAPRWRAVRRLDAGDALLIGVGVIGVGEVGTDSADTLDGATRTIADTVQAWRSWLMPFAYSGPYRLAVERSLLAVRSLTSPAGAPISAATTSLPRRAGSERTSDERWAYLRDAAAAVAVMAATGMAEDAEAAETWLRQVVADLPLPWPPALDPDGQPAPELEELALEGWRRSGPVVVGVPQEVVDLGLLADIAGSIGVSMTGPGGRRGDAGPLSAAWPALAGAADWLSDHWSDPDRARWEVAGPPRQHVASKLEAWCALDRMVRSARARNPLDLQPVAWHQEAAALLKWLEQEAVAPDGGLMREAADGSSDEPDAALLQVAWRGPWPAAHPIVAATVDRVLERLSAGPFLYRYSDRVDDGRSGPDNPDLLASLWAVKALAAMRRWEEAHERMEAVSALGGDLGLLSEAVDPLTGELMGNLPSTPVHLALVDAAWSLRSGPA